MYTKGDSKNSALTADNSVAPWTLTGITSFGSTFCKGRSKPPGEYFIEIFYSTESFAIEIFFAFQSSPKSPPISTGSRNISSHERQTANRIFLII